MKVIAAQATAHGWQVADTSAATGDRAAALTNVLNGDVRPTARGYQAIGYAVTQAYKKNPSRSCRSLHSPHRRRVARRR
jgi:hypothetical protein